MSDELIVGGLSDRERDLVGRFASLLTTVPDPGDGASMGRWIAARSEVQACLDGVGFGVVAAFDASLEWAADGNRSAASWLVDHTGCARASAGAVLKTSRVVRDLEHVAEAARSGELSAEKVHWLTRARQDDVAELFDRDEAHLVRVATKLSVDALRVQLLAWRLRVLEELGRNDADGPAPVPDGEADRLHLHATIGGRGLIDGELDPASRAVLFGAVSAEIEAWFRAGTLTDDGRSRAELNAKALLDIVARGCAAGVEHGGPRPLLIALADLTTLAELGVTFDLGGFDLERLADLDLTGADNGGVDLTGVDLRHLLRTLLAAMARTTGDQSGPHGPAPDGGGDGDGDGPDEPDPDSHDDAPGPDGPVPNGGGDARPGGGPLPDDHVPDDGGDGLVGPDAPGGAGSDRPDPDPTPGPGTGPGGGGLEPEPDGGRDPVRTRAGAPPGGTGTAASGDPPGFTPDARAAPARSPDPPAVRRCEIVGVGPVPTETIRSLLGDVDVAPVLLGPGGMPLLVGRRRRVRAGPTGRPWPGWPGWPGSPAGGLREGTGPRSQRRGPDSTAPVQLDVDGSMADATSPGTGALATAVRVQVEPSAPVRLALEPRPLDLGRMQRLASNPQWLALLARSAGTCEVPGCTAPYGWCRAHHRTYWRRQGPTDIDNLLLVCDHHHDHVLHAGFTAQWTPGTARAVLHRPDGAAVVVPHGDRLSYGPDEGARLAA